MTSTEAKDRARMLGQLFTTLEDAAASAADPLHKRAPEPPDRIDVTEYGNGWSNGWTDGYAQGWASAVTLAKVTAASIAGQMICEPHQHDLTTDDAPYAFHNAHCVRRDELHLGGCPIE